MVVKKAEWLGDDFGLEELSDAVDEISELRGSNKGPFHTFEQSRTNGVVPSRTEGFVESAPPVVRDLLVGENSPLVRLVRLATATTSTPRLYKEKINYKFLVEAATARTKITTRVSAWTSTSTRLTAGS